MTRKTFLSFTKLSIIFLCGATIYPLMEISWRGFSHVSMAIAGGICLLLINAVCCVKLKNSILITKCFLGSLIITVVEFIVGIIVNEMLMLRIWDYSYLPFNFMGQIALPFSLLWFFITIPAVFLCGFISMAVDKLNKSPVKTNFDV